MSVIREFPWGWLGTYDDNEIEIVSTISDPPKVRLAVDSNKIESNLGAVTFNIRRPDGRHEEYGYVMGRLTADRQEGAVYIGVRGRNDSQSREVLYIDPNQAIFRVPVTAPGLGGGIGGRVALRSHHGYYICVEPDGRLVANRTDAGPWETLEVVGV